MNFWQQKINKRKRLVPLQNFEMSYTKIDLFFFFFFAKNRFYLQCILFFTPSFERFLSLVWQFFSKVRLLMLKVLWAKTVWTCDCCKFHLQMKAGPRPNASADVMNIQHFMKLCLGAKHITHQDLKGWCDQSVRCTKSLLELKICLSFSILTILGSFSTKRLSWWGIGFFKKELYCRVIFQNMAILGDGGFFTKGIGQKCMRSDWYHVLFSMLASPPPKKVPFLLCARVKTVCQFDFHWVWDSMR